ncbi:MAG TPA: hypothetical protein VD866_07660 [Urbifossiella sp.]|nr:hypothetical protein [Urbifossiella sp.]
MTIAEPIDPTRVKTTLTPEDRAADSDAAPVATALGLFSIALGLAELAAPHWVAARTGVPYPNLIRAYGLRELAAGVGILQARRPAPYLWARVAGDVLDLATLAAAYAGGQGTGRYRAGRALASVAAVTAADVACAAAHS